MDSNIPSLYTDYFHSSQVVFSPVSCALNVTIRSKIESISKTTHPRLGIECLTQIFDDVFVILSRVASRFGNGDGPCGVRRLRTGRWTARGGCVKTRIRRTLRMTTIRPWYRFFTRRRCRAPRPWFGRGCDVPAQTATGSGWGGYCRCCFWRRDFIFLVFVNGVGLWGHQCTCNIIIVPAG